jgi:hypothetical protein
LSAAVWFQGSSLLVLASTQRRAKYKDLLVVYNASSLVLDFFIGGDMAVGVVR